MNAEEIHEAIFLMEIIEGSESNKVFKTSLKKKLLRVVKHW